MTKKHYIKLAEIIKKNNYYKKVELIHKENFMSDLVKYLKEENPRFDEKRFSEACQ